MLSQALNRAMPQSRNQLLPNAFKVCITVINRIKNKVFDDGKLKESVHM